MKHKHFCVQAVGNKEFKEFIDKLNELYFAGYRGNAYGTYYGIYGEGCFNKVKPFGKLVTPEEGIKILLGKVLTYDL